MTFEVKILYGGKVNTHYVSGETADLADMAAEHVAKIWGGTIKEGSLRAVLADSHEFRTVKEKIKALADILSDLNIAWEALEEAGPEACAKVAKGNPFPDGLEAAKDAAREWHERVEKIKGD